MASQYSIIHQYTPYISPYNIDLLASGMQYKQERADANQAMINQYVTSMMDMEIDKEEDREYFDNKVNNLVNYVNKNFRGQDLSSQGVASAILNQVGAAIDTKVVNAVSTTKMWRKFRSDLEDMKLSNPKMYSAINEEYAMLPYYQWLNDGQVGTTSSRPHYTPFTDYKKKLSDKVMELRKLNKPMKFTEFSDKLPGRMLEKTVDRMTDAEIYTIASSLLDENDLAQMNIDAWANVQRNPGMYDHNTTRDFINANTKASQNRISLLRDELRKAGSDQARRDAIKSSISMEEQRMNSFIERASSAIGGAYDPIRAASFMVRENTLNGIASAYSYDHSTVQVKTDDAYFKAKDLELQYERFALDKWYKKQNLEISRMNAESNRLRALAKAGGKGMTGDGESALDLRSLPNYTTQDIGTTNQQEIERDAMYSDLAASTDGFNRSMSSALDALSDKGKSLRDTLEARRGRGDFSGMDDNEALYSIINESKMSDVSGFTGDFEVAMKDVSKYQNQRNRTRKYLKRNTEIIDEVVNANSGEVLNRLHDDNSFDMFVPGLNPMTGKEIKRYNSIHDTEDEIGDNVVMANAFARAVTTSSGMLINYSNVSEINKAFPVEFPNLSPSSPSIIVFDENITNPENMSLVQKISDMYGEDINPMRLFLGGSDGKYVLNPEFKDTNTYKTLMLQLGSTNTVKAKGIIEGILKRNYDYVGDLINGTQARALMSENFKEYAGNQSRFKPITLYKNSASDPGNIEYNKMATSYVNLYNAKNPDEIKTLDSLTGTNSMTAHVSGFDRNTGRATWVLYPQGRQDMAVELPSTWWADNGFVEPSVDNRAIKANDVEDLEFDGMTYATKASANELRRVAENNPEITKAITAQDAINYIDNMYGNSIYQFPDEDGNMVDIMLPVGGQNIPMRDIVRTIVKNPDKFRTSIGFHTARSGATYMDISLWDKAEYDDQPDPDNPIIKREFQLPGEYVDDYIYRAQLCPTYYFIEALVSDLLNPIRDNISQKADEIIRTGKYEFDVDDTILKLYAAAARQHN